MTHRAPPLGVYVHLPWCVSKCPYCDFNSHTFGASASIVDYVRALEADIAAEAGYAAGRAIESVFIGGGTPSLFPPAQIASILECLGSHLRLAPDAEITMEANPGTIERGNLRDYRNAGVTRLSLGAQSFNPESLRRLGRIHGPDEVLTAFSEARAAGFESINLDLMFALPGQTAAMARGDVRQAIQLGAEHISYYQLTLEPNTVFYARPPAELPDGDQGHVFQDAGFALLAAAGYGRYEVSAFCQPDHACRHNLNYWSFGDYLAVGAGAHGKITDQDGCIWRTVKTAHPASYLREAREAEIGRNARLLDTADIQFEFMLNVLRLEAGFSLGLYTARTGLAAKTLLPRLRAAQSAGLLEPLADDRWRPTELGFRFLNDLQAWFLPGEDPAPGTAPTARTAPAVAAVMHKTQS